MHYTKKITALFLITLVCNTLISCQGQMSKQSSGTLVGGAAGGLVGSQFGKGSGQLVATGFGALAGALVGGNIGKNMDEYDKRLMEKSSHQALEFAAAGNTVEWHNPDSGNHGTITPTNKYNESGRYCREYQQEVVIGGEKKQAYGKGCRQPDGNWKIVQ
jgi:surface antigen